MESVIVQKQGGEEYIEDRITQLSQHLEICKNHLDELSKIGIEPIVNTQNQTSHKIYNISKIDNANFS